MDHLSLQLLGYIHQQKRQQGVDQMLLRCYEPFLFRSLKVGQIVIRVPSVTPRSCMTRTVPRGVPRAGVYWGYLVTFTRQQKRQQGVDQMLLKCYEPFLFRSLKVGQYVILCYLHFNDWQKKQGENYNTYSKSHS